jgi:hypothetical protein
MDVISANVDVDMEENGVAVGGTDVTREVLLNFVLENLPITMVPIPLNIPLRVVVENIGVPREIPLPRTSKILAKVVLQNIGEVPTPLNIPVRVVLKNVGVIMEVPLPPNILARAVLKKEERKLPSKGTCLRPI